MRLLGRGVGAVFWGVRVGFGRGGRASQDWESESVGGGSRGAGWGSAPGSRLFPALPRASTLPFSFTLGRCVFAGQRPRLLPPASPASCHGPSLFSNPPLLVARRPRSSSPSSLFTPRPFSPRRCPLLPLCFFLHASPASCHGPPLFSNPPLLVVRRASLVVRRASLVVRRASLVARRASLLGPPPASSPSSGAYVASFVGNSAADFARKRAAPSKSPSASLRRAISRQRSASSLFISIVCENARPAERGRMRTRRERMRTRRERMRAKREDARRERERKRREREEAQRGEVQRKRRRLEDDDRED